MRKWREELITAPPDALLSLPASLWTASREDLESAIAARLQSISDANREVGQLREYSREQLKQIGLFVSADDADSLLLPIQEDIVSMAAVITNVACLTAQLECLLQDSGESPAYVRRYYGMFLLLVCAIDRVQMHFAHEVDETYLPRLDRLGEDARENAAVAKREISLGGPREQLVANVEAGEAALQACRLLSDGLRKQRSVVTEQNAFTKRMLAAAVNTYRTVRLSLDVAEVARDCRVVFRAIEGLRTPRLRPFQGEELKREMQRICECIEQGCL